MRVLLIATAALVGGYFLAQGIDAGSARREEARQAQVADDQARQERVARERADREAQVARDRAEAERAREKMSRDKPAIEAALAELAARGIARGDVKLYFYDELYEEIEKDIREADEGNQ